MACCKVCTACALPFIWQWAAFPCSLIANYICTTTDSTLQCCQGWIPTFRHWLLGNTLEPRHSAQPAASGPTTSTPILTCFPQKSIAYYKTKIERYVRTQELFTQNGTVRKALLHKLPTHRWTERASRTQVPKARYYNCGLWFSSSFDYRTACILAEVLTGPYTLRR